MSKKLRGTTIRSATVRDTSALLDLVHKLAIYEKKKPVDIKLTAEKIITHGFSARPYFYVLVAENEQELIGYALYFFTYAASIGAPILYLEDMFVMNEHRQKGIGKKMLAELAKIAEKEGCCRMEWHAFTWNTSAIAFYQSLDAVLKTDLVQIRLGSEAMRRLLNDFIAD